MKLECNIEQTWQMLRDQSAKAAARAEQTMLSVRNIFDLSHDLGAVRRHFGASAEDHLKAHNLSQHSDWWNLPQDQRARQLRDYWRNNLVPRDILLSQESNRVFVSMERELEEPYINAKKKRILVTTSREVMNKWHFEIPARSYEVWTMLCWREEDYWLYDFVIPQKFFAQEFSVAKKTLKKDDKIGVTIARVEDNHFLLGIGDQTPKRIDDLRSNYEPLQ